MPLNLLHSVMQSYGLCISISETSQNINNLLQLHNFAHMWLIFSMYVFVICEEKQI